MAYSSQDKFGIGSGIGGILGGIAGLFGNKNKTNPGDVANRYIGQIPGATQGYNQPYYNAGTSALSGLQQQYGQLMNNPGQRLNEIGGEFHQSPGFQFALQQALQGANHAAAAGGMAGSPQNQQQDMQLATNLANQDYYNYLNGATGLYGQGLQGAQGMANQGQQAGNNLSDMIAQALASQAGYAYEGQKGKNEATGNSLGSLFGGLGTLGAFAF